MLVKKVTLFVAADNSQHSSKKAAEHHNQSLALKKGVREFFEKRIGDLTSEQFKGVDKAAEVLIRDRDVLVNILTNKSNAKRKPAPKADPKPKAGV